MKKIFPAILLILSTFLTTTALASSEIRGYANLSQVHHAVKKLSPDAKPHEIWLVYDIDNTLLAGIHPMATSEWFDWQASLIKENNKSSFRTATTIDQLVSQQIRVFDWAAMKPVENDTVSIVEALQAQGYHSMVLTARSPETFPATFRELYDHDLFFTESSQPLMPQYQYPKSLTHHYPVIFEDGIMMVSGQNKGLLLKQLFEDQQIAAKYIVFVDDSSKNITDVANAFAEDNNYHVIAVHYTQTEAKVQQFERADKQRWFNDYLEFLNLWEKIRVKAAS
jgi:hypothetical protein